MDTHEKIKPGDLVVVSHWSDFDWPSDAVELGRLREIKAGYYYINYSTRGYKHCRFVHRPQNDKMNIFPRSDHIRLGNIEKEL